MQYIYAIIFGIVQGITEFVPVSSSGHLVLLHQITNFNFSDNVAFDVALHLGTTLALLIFFAKELIQYIKKRDRILWLMFLGCLPAGIIGFLFEDMITANLRSDWIVVIMLIVVGFAFLLIEKYAQKIAVKSELSDLSVKSAFKIGFAQALALIPGTSRSGISIFGGLACNLSREAAARFAFLIGLPIFMAAGLKKSLDFDIIHSSNEEMILFSIGLLTSAIVGYFSIKYLLRFLANHKLNAFAYYRFALAGVIIIYLLVNQWF